MGDHDPENGLVHHIRFIVDEHPEHGLHGAIPELTNWQPLFNLCTTSDGVIIHIELPGVELPDVVVLLRSRYMVITGTRIMPAAITDDRCTFHNLEIPFGRFHRRIDFPVPVETQGYRYEIHKGILTLRLRTVQEKFITIEGE